MVNYAMDWCGIGYGVGNYGRQVMNELDVQQGYGRRLREIALFAGAGGGIRASQILGWETVCAVERDAYAAQILAQRQNDGILEAFPIWSDVCSFDGKRWRGIVDIISGGFPCQDISIAGKGAGIEGERSGLWSEFARIISEVMPRYVFVENSPMLTIRGLGTVLGDLAKMGFDAEWGVLSAADVGANHQRERFWLLGRNTQRELAYTNMRRCNDRQAKINTAKGRFDAQCFSSSGSADVANAMRTRLEITHVTGDSSQATRGKQQGSKPIGVHAESYADFWSTEPDVGRVADGVAFRMDRIKAIGNGQVPICAAMAFELLSKRFG